MPQQPHPVPTAHVDDEQSTATLADTLTELHGEPYEFVDRWESGPSSPLRTRESHTGSS